MRVFVTGGTGLVGNVLVRKLRERGDLVVLLTRRPDAVRLQYGDGVTIVAGDPLQQGPWMDAIKDCDAVVHLAGEGIFNRRWTQAFKDEIYASRIKGTDNVVAALGKHPGSPTKTLISASAIGYYGPHGDEELGEDSSAGADYLAKVCVDWEKAALPCTVHGIRLVHLRTGIVLDTHGGALAKMLTPFKMCVGGPIGSGKQWMSWIHNEDEVGLILFALDRADISGPLNAVAPHPVTNKEFGNVLGKVLGRPSFLPTPGFALRVLVGESAQIITSGQRVLPRKALAAGYTFEFPDLEPALRELLAK